MHDVSQFRGIDRKTGYAEIRPALEDCCVQQEVDRRKEESLTSMKIRLFLVTQDMNVVGIIHGVR